MVHVPGSQLHFHPVDFKLCLETISVFVTQQPKQANKLNRCLIDFFQIDDCSLNYKSVCSATLRIVIKVSDLSLREISSLVPLAIFVFWIGLYPTFFLRPISGDLQRTTRRAVIEFQRQSTMPITIKPPLLAGTNDSQGNEVTYVD